MFGVILYRVLELWTPFGPYLRLVSEASLWVHNLHDYAYPTYGSALCLCPMCFWCVLVLFLAHACNMFLLVPGVCVLYSTVGRTVGLCLAFVRFCPFGWITHVVKLTLLAPHSRPGNKTLGIRIGKV